MNMLAKTMANGQNESGRQGAGNTYTALNETRTIRGSAMTSNAKDYGDSAFKCKSAKPDLTSGRLREVLDYNQDTGRFVWLVGRGQSTPGRKAGSINGRGYVQICVDGKHYLAHRLAWLFVTGRWPEHVVDHINGDTSDNRLVNLRDVTLSANLRNCRGRAGMHVSRGRWYVKAGGQYIGSSLCFGRAVAMRTEAYVRFGYGPCALRKDAC